MSGAKTRTGAEIIAARLAEAGCRYSFGIPGGEVLALMGALDDAGVAFHLTKHENAAGFMAEGAWHAGFAQGRDAPGVLLATIGPGVANAVNTVANAMQDRVPLIFLTGCVDGALGDTYTHQVFDHQQLLRPIVKGSFRAHAGSVGVMIDKAIALAMDGQPGPVHVDVPISVAENECDEPALPPLVERSGTVPDSKTLERAMVAVARAKRPLVIAGVDALNDLAGDAVAAFCEATGAPLVTTYKGKGLVPESALLCLGGHGLSPKSDKHILPLIGQADCVVLAGYDPIEMRVGWRDLWACDATVIDVTPVLRDHGMHRIDMRLTGSVRQTLEALTPEDVLKGSWSDGKPARVGEALEDAFAPSNSWGPARVFATMREALPADAVITADSGAHRILLSQMWRCHEPRTMLQSSALCTMACAVPIAAGYKLAAPERAVCAFVGDAGLEMGLGELATLRDHSIPLTICVLVDESLTLIEMKQRASQRRNVGVDFTGSDFPAIAAAMGGHGVWIDDANMLTAEAEAALARDTFTVLACRIGRRAYEGLF